MKKAHQWLFSIAALLVLPLLVLKQAYILHLLIVALMYSIIASNWDVLMGYAGIMSFGQLGFYGVGVYLSGTLSKFFGVSPWISIWIGCGAAALWALLIGVVTLRLRGIYLALVTLGFIELVKVIAINYFTLIMKRSYRVVALPRFQIGSWRFDYYNGIAYYYLIFAILLLSILVNTKMLKSHIGLSFIAIRDSEPRALTLGVNPVKVKLLVFVTAAVFTSLVGAFSAHYYCFMVTDMFLFGVMSIYFLILSLGGWGTFYGPILASFIWVALDEGMRPLKLWRYVIIGVIIMIVLLFAPQGLLRYLTKSYEKIRARMGVKPQEEVIFESAQVKS